MTPRWLMVLAVPVLALAAACAPAKPPPASPGAVTFSYTGGPQYWVVPAGIHLAAFDLYGAQGGDNRNPNQTSSAAGLGGRTTLLVPVVPGEVFQINVGGQGGDNDIMVGCDRPAGGFNGGGRGGRAINPFVSGGGGGGASDVRRGGVELADRVLVAGGGGGGDTNVGGVGDGGAGGAPAGGDGADGALVGGGDGGTQSAGGTGGSGAPTAFNGGTGGFGTGGDGGSDEPGCPDDFTAGGGGGGGYFGGGGAGGDDGNNSPAGGGGGSSAGPPGTVYENGVETGDGKVVIAYQP